MKTRAPLVTLLASLALSTVCAPVAAESYDAHSRLADFQPEEARYPQPDSVADAIYFASRVTSVDYGYLLAQAQLESSMNPNAQAPTSSASGLFQFIKSTWISTLGRHATRFALDRFGQHIAHTSSGQYFVPDKAMRRKILALRFDPRIASLMAASLAADNRDRLRHALNRTPKSSELYLAHFLGARGAISFLLNLERRPWEKASALFPAAARANARIFYERNGSPRSLASVMNVIRSKFERARRHVAYRYPVNASYAQLLEASLRRDHRPQPYVIVDEDVFALEWTTRASPQNLVHQRADAEQLHLWPLDASM